MPIDPPIVKAATIVKATKAEAHKPVLKRIGRPPKYTEDMGRDICALHGEGWSLARIAEIDGMPAKSTMMAWAADPDHPFSDRYVRACEIRLAGIADELNDIADDARNDWMTIHTAGGEIEVENREVVNRSKLRIQTRMWELSHLMPKTYGRKKPEEPTAKADGTAAFIALLEHISGMRAPTEGGKLIEQKPDAGKRGA